jgi:hypothetical protein
MRIVEGLKKKGYGYKFPNGDWNLPFWVWIDFDLPPDADPEWQEHCPAPDPEGRPNCRTVRQAHVDTLEEAQAHLAAWTPERLKLLVAKPLLWWSISTAASLPGWLTKSGKAKWEHTLSNEGWIFAALENTDADWRQGITREWVYAMTFWETHGGMYAHRKWWGSGPAPEEAQKHYDRMTEVKAKLESPECPAPIQKWYKGIFEL